MNSQEQTLDRRLCQVGGRNENYVSRSGTLYHYQIEDRGPVVDAVTDAEVRRVNLIVYANYGEPNARIIHGRDYDFPDLRTAEHNRFVEQRIVEIAAEARAVVEDREERQVARIKGLLREYYLTKDEGVKRQFEEANQLYPFLFSRAFRELKAEKEGAAPQQPVPPQPAPPVEETVDAPSLDVVYPLEKELREKVIEIERIIIELGHDLQVLKQRGKADDILLQTCRKLVLRAKESLAGRDAEFSVRRLEMTRNSLMTTWRQVKSRLSPR